MKMRFRKTPMSRRVSYCYESVTGEKFRISAEEYGAETVSLLHRMDDSEVRNNLSTGKPGIQKWQEEAARQWRERHPDEEPPKNWVLSLDSLTGEDGSGMADDSRYMKEAVDRAAQEEADPLKELLHECVEEMDGDSQRLYHGGCRPGGDCEGVRDLPDGGQQEAEKAGSRPEKGMPEKT